ncbi:MAG: C1 family peptidase, partial [Prevotella sp.]|nr:C1 family peptidase [Prevotella sp.]
GFTSFTHHPFGAPFILEVPDNNFQDSYMNVPIDSLLTLITSTIKSGHPVCWEGDISEPGFRYDLGTATLTPGQQPVTQQTRQQDFENKRTTDDHCMEICGLAHDQNGQPFFIMKNSWGASNRYGGFMYVSYDYVKAKTICVMVPQLVP